jgi:hypothetical protein
MKAFENNVLKIFRPNRDEVKGGWRKLNNKELHNLYSSSHMIRMIKSRMKWVRHVVRMGGVRNAYKILVRTPK